MRLAEDPAYTRLPGSRRALMGDVQYWLARDHLLLVEVVGMVEKYRRFDLQELVALTVRPTRQRLWQMLVLGLLAGAILAFGVFLIFLSPTDETRLIGEVCLGLPVILLGMMGGVLWVGPSCELRLTTSVQTLVLPGLHRRKGAEMFRAALLRAVQPTVAASSPAPPPRVEGPGDPPTVA